MGTLLATGSILAAFLAGAVALFSPCCIVFLLPAYLASAVKNRRWRLLPLTFVFALGLATVLLPVTLGVGMVMSALRRFHTPLYAAGGVILLALAVLSLLGKSWSLPRFVRAPAVERSDTAGLFVLGAFSGVASSCCAPVLAGVMALSALSGSWIGSAALGIAYVFGMVFPLFLTALLWDRFKLGERRILRAKPVRLRLAGTTVRTSTVNIGVALAFGLMGGFVLYLAASGNTTSAPAFQLVAGRWLSEVAARLVRFLDPIPEPILGLALLALAAYFSITALRRSTTEQGGAIDEHRDRLDEALGAPAMEEGRTSDALPQGGPCHGAEGPTGEVTARSEVETLPRT